MIDHLSIKNFLAFPELEVPELKLINLVAGKNNAGKTALLEALNIAGGFNKNKIIEDLAKKRKYKLRHQDLAEPSSVNDAALMHGVDLFEINNLIVHATLTDYHILFKNKEGKLIKSDEYALPPDFLLPKPKPTVFVPSQSDYSVLSKLWSKVALTNLEDDVLEILSLTMDKVVSRISITDDEILVREKGHNEPYNINTLGDGAKRILLLALSLVQSKSGLLLMDEIETHLHHSVIRKLWKIIFEYAIKWNIQVVATTHSQDAIREFWYEAAENPEHQKVSQVLRLQLNREGKHEVIQFPFERLDSVMEMQMEIR